MGEAKDIEIRARMADEDLEAEYGRPEDQEWPDDGELRDDERSNLD